MYSRPPRQDLRVPHNYSGSIFDSRPTPATPVEDLTTKHRPAPIQPPEQECAAESTAEEICEKKADAPILSAFGDLGSEELLLIALALIIFQGGKDPQLGLILLALLFIN